MFEGEEELGFVAELERQIDETRREDAATAKAKRDAETQQIGKELRAKLGLDKESEKVKDKGLIERSKESVAALKAQFEGATFDPSATGVFSTFIGTAAGLAVGASIKKKDDPNTKILERMNKTMKAVEKNTGKGSVATLG